MNRGLTLIELLLTIAIVAVLSVSATPFLGRTVLAFQMISTQDRVAAAIYKAQTYSMHHRQGKEWGVCLTGGSLRLFASSCSSPTYSEDWPIPMGISVSGFSSLTFGVYRGEPSSTATISVTSDLGTNQIIINRIGGTSVN